MKTRNELILDGKDITRFMSKIDNIKDNSCWEWNANKNTKGYGRISIKSKMHKAHRVSWIIHNGQILDGLCVCHKCDNPGCVNPAHLFLGTHKDNAVDRENKGRGGDKQGEKNGANKLTEKQVIEIREKYIPHVYSTRELAKEFNVSQAVIHRIVTYRKWGKHEKNGASEVF